MAKSKVTQKKVSLSDLNNHNITNKRQALKDSEGNDVENDFSIRASYSF